MRGEDAGPWLLGVVLVGVLFAGVLVAGRAVDTAAGPQPAPAEPVGSRVEEAAPTDPAGQQASAEPAEQETSAEPADRTAREGEAVGLSALTGGAAPVSSSPPDHPDIQIPYRVQVRTADARAADFPAVVHDALGDPRGWARAGFRFVRDADAAYTIVIAEGGEVDRLCHPYDTAGSYSCQNGPVVAINADRWRSATPEWPGSLAGYRTMLVNHEVGHLLHLHHPEPQCPAAGLPAPVMAQQSGGADPCQSHSWPLQWEIDRAAQRREPLAPSSSHDVSEHRPTPPPASS